MLKLNQGEIEQYKVEQIISMRYESDENILNKDVLQRRKDEENKKEAKSKTISRRKIKFQTEEDN